MPQVIDSDEYNVAGVYTVTQKASGRTYVGEAFNIRERWMNGHIGCLNDNRHGNRFLQRAWNKYGPDAFEFKIFTVVENTENLSKYLFKKKLKWHENEVLKLFPKNYNLEIPGENGYVIPGPRAKRMMKKAAKRERNTEIGRARMKRVRLEAMKNPIAVARHKKATKEAWQNPEIKAARVAAYNTPEGKKNRASGAALGWIKRKEKLANDPEFAARHKESRAKANKKIKELYNTPERKNMLSKQADETWAVPGRKGKVTESLEEYYSDPKNRTRHSKIMLEHFEKKKSRKLSIPGDL
jgi:hypothetical protein